MINIKIFYTVPCLKEIIISLIRNERTGKQTKIQFYNKFWVSVQSNEKAYQKLVFMGKWIKTFESEIRKVLDKEVR